MSERIEDLVEIQQLLARYAVTITQEDIDGLVAVFTPDGTYSAFGETYSLDRFPVLVDAAPKGLFLTAAAVIELSGDTAWSFAEFAAEVSKQSGRHVPYHAVTGEEYAAMLSGAGLPAPLPHVMAGIAASIAAGELALTTGDLSRLAGRPTTPVADAIAAALAG